jgi:hypothetical protein
MKSIVGPLYGAHLLVPSSGPSTVNFIIFVFYLMTEGYPAFEALRVFNRNGTLEKVKYM